MTLNHAPLERRSNDAAPTVTSAGVTLSAVQALTEGQSSWTSDQVAYIIALSYETGQLHARIDDLAETIGIWSEHDQPIRETITPAYAKSVRERRKAERLAEYERLSGPVRFHGGLPAPASVYRDAPSARRPPFPTLAAQSRWLSSEDVSFCRRLSQQQPVRYPQRAAA